MCAILRLSSPFVYSSTHLFAVSVTIAKVCGPSKHTVLLTLHLFLVDGAAGTGARGTAGAVIAAHLELSWMTDIRLIYRTIGVSVFGLVAELGELLDFVSRKAQRQRRSGGVLRYLSTVKLAHSTAR